MSTEEVLAEQSALVRLLQDVAVASNEARTVDDALQACLDRVCAHTGWPVGHAYLLSEQTGEEMVPTRLWYLDEPARFKPTMNIYLSSAQPWAPLAQGLQNFEKMPG